MIVGGKEPRGSLLWIDPEMVTAVIGPTISTHSPETYTVRLKNGDVFTVDLDDSLIAAMNRWALRPM